MKKNNTDAFSKKVKVPKLTEEDRQFEKKRINGKKVYKPLFGKEVNDPSERGHD